MPRTLRRIATTAAASVVLLVVTALPALAAAGTKPDPDENPWLIGSLGELLTTFVVGALVAVIAWVLMPSRSEAVEDEHH